MSSLIDWYQHDLDVSARLPVLSSYLGHASTEATYWYLQAAPELLALAADKLERHQDEKRTTSGQAMTS